MRTAENQTSPFLTVCSGRSGGVSSGASLPLPLQHRMRLVVDQTQSQAHRRRTSATQSCLSPREDVKPRCPHQLLPTRRRKDDLKDPLRWYPLLKDQEVEEGRKGEAKPPPEPTSTEGLHQPDWRDCPCRRLPHFALRTSAGSAWRQRTSCTWASRAASSAARRRCIRALFASSSLKISPLSQEANSAAQRLPFSGYPSCHQSRDGRRSDSPTRAKPMWENAPSELAQLGQAPTRNLGAGLCKERQLPKVQKYAPHFEQNTFQDPVARRPDVMIVATRSACSSKNLGSMHSSCGNTLLVASKSSTNVPAAAAVSALRLAPAGIKGLRILRARCFGLLSTDALAPAPRAAESCAPPQPIPLPDGPRTLKLPHRQSNKMEACVCQFPNWAYLSAKFTPCLCHSVVLPGSSMCDLCF